jgi:hypothetical protein
MYNGLQQEQNISEVVSQMAARPSSTGTDANIRHNMQCSGTPAHAADINLAQNIIVLSNRNDLAKHSCQVPDPGFR